MTPSPWTREEVYLIVHDYLEMWRLELCGQPYRKVDHWRALLPKLQNRTKGSIEFKHGNISAVMERLGLPFIEGYKPAYNYQKILVDILQEVLQQHENHKPGWAHQQVAQRLPHVTVPVVPADFESLLVKAPSLPTPQEKQTPFPVARHYNFDHENLQRKNLGHTGEAFVIAWEQARLKAQGPPDKWKEIEWVSQTQGDGAGYDIRSFQRNGEPLYIEVKTTRFSKRQPFSITRNELRFSQQHAANFGLYRVFDFADSHTPGLYQLFGDLHQNCHLTPLDYEARPY